VTPVQICFTPDAAELQSVQAAYANARPRLSIGLAFVLAVMYFLLGVQNLTSRHGDFHWFGYILIFFGIAYVPLSRRMQKVMFLRATPAVEIDLTIDDAGIAIAHPATRIPWKRISAIRDVGEAFVVTQTFGKDIPILKRALPDGGSALWAALDAKLTATRYLVRGSDSRSMISNSAARR